MKFSQDKNDDEGEESLIYKKNQHYAQTASHQQSGRTFWQIEKYLGCYRLGSSK